MIWGNSLAHSLLPVLQFVAVYLLPDPSDHAVTQVWMNARYGLALQVSSSCRGEVDAAYHPTGSTTSGSLEKVRKPATLLVFEMYAQQKNLTRLQVLDVSAAARRRAPCILRKMFGALFRNKNCELRSGATLCSTL